jgi:RecA/RadA recombinase
MGNLNAARNHHAAYGRIAHKRRVAKKAAAVQQTLAGLDPEYLEKLKHDCLRAAHNRLRGASPAEVVRQAQEHFDASVRFLTGAKS